MGQLTLEYSTREDLAFILSFAKRINVPVISILPNHSENVAEQRRAMLQKVANDPLEGALCK